MNVEHSGDPYIKDSMREFGETIFAEMSALAVNTGAINLGQGFPDTDGPREIAELAITAIRDGHNQYPPGLGIKKLRDAISHHQMRFYGLDFDAETEILVTAGATEAIAASLLAICEQVDEIITFEPYYDSYAASIALAGGVRRVVTLNTPEYTFSIDDLEKLINVKTKAILLNSPHNPTGKVFTHDDIDKVKIEFKDDATAFNALKKEKFEGKGKLNCLISARIFEILIKKNIPTHFIELENENTMIAKKIKVIPLEIVLRNTAYGSLCKQTTIKPGTLLSKPLIDIYLKNDELNDPLVTKDRIELMNILSSHDLELIINLTLKINVILKSFFKNIQLQLVDFKLEFGYDFRNNIILGDEISPDNCRLWDLNQKNDIIVSLDKDRFRNDLGGLIEAYSEIHRRINDFLKPN